MYVATARIELNFVAAIIMVAKSTMVASHANETPSTDVVIPAASARAGASAGLFRIDSGIMALPYSP